MTRTLTEAELTGLTNPPWQLHLITYTFIGPTNLGYWDDDPMNGTNADLDGIVRGKLAQDIERVSAEIETDFTAAAQAWMAVGNFVLTETTGSVGDISVGAIKFGSPRSVDALGATVPTGDRTNPMDGGPESYPTRGDMWFDNGTRAGIKPPFMDPGGSGYLSVLHEIGHALGLRGDEPLGGSQWNNQRYSIWQDPDPTSAACVNGLSTPGGSLNLQGRALTLAHTATKYQ
jgi:hypothetical protein